MYVLVAQLDMVDLVVSCQFATERCPTIQLHVVDQQEAMDVPDQTLVVARLDTLETNVKIKFVTELHPIKQMFVLDMVHVTPQINAHVPQDMVDQTVNIQFVLE